MFPDKHAQDELFSWIDDLREIGPEREVGVGNIRKITRFGFKCFAKGYRAGKDAAEKEMRTQRAHAKRRVSG